MSPDSKTESLFFSERPFVLAYILLSRRVAYLVIGTATLERVHVKNHTVIWNVPALLPNSLECGCLLPHSPWQRENV